MPRWQGIAERASGALRRHRGRFDPTLEGACGVASVLLVLALREHRIPCRFEQARLPRYRFSHVWVEVARTPVDLTATQFGFSEPVRLKRICRGEKVRPSTISRFLRAQRPREIWHRSEPRRNFDVLVPALAEVLGISRTEARKRVRAFCGREVRS